VLHNNPSDICDHVILSNVVQLPIEPEIISLNNEVFIGVHATRIKLMLDTLTGFFPDIDINIFGRVDVIYNLVCSAFIAADLDYNVEKAVEWGDGFEFPEETFIKDVEELASMNYDLLGLIHSRQLCLLPDRLNHDRLKDLDPLDPDTIRLHDLVDGIRVPVDPSFVEDRIPQKADNRYRVAHSAVDKMWYKLYQAGFILLIPSEVLTQLPVNFKLNYSPPGWARKRGKCSGRPTCDFSRANRHGVPLNTNEVKRVVKEYYGDINPVTIDELSKMILRQASRVGWENIIIWKMDLKGAFNLLFFRAEDAPLMAMEMTNGLSMISLVGSFGHTATPFGFDVLSRVILKLVKKDLIGSVEIYCDDLMGCCALGELEHDLNVARIHIEKLAGSQSIAEDKTETGRSLDFIGWSMNLDTHQVGIARHNFLKTFYGFCIARTERFLSVRGIQKLASWASRYSLVCRHMRPFTHYLYSNCSGYRNLETLVQVTDDLRLVIDLWLMFLLLAEIEPIRFNRSMESFGSIIPSLHGNIDASLTGIGLVASRIYPSDNTITNEGQLCASDLCTIAVVGCILPYDLKCDSSYQNTVEFIAEVILQSIFTSFGFRGLSVLLQGDSTSALSWASKEKFRVGRSTAASIMWIQLQQQNEQPIESVSHIPGEMNLVSDALSRGTSARELGFHPKVIYHLEDNPTLCAILTSLNPTVSINLSADLKAIWLRNQAWIDILKGPGGGWSSNRSRSY